MKMIRVVAAVICDDIQTKHKTLCHRPWLWRV